MLFSDVQVWLGRLEEEVCGKRKRIRGRIFDGIRLEMYVDGEVVVILNPSIEGESIDSRTVSFIKNCLDSRVLECFIAPDRLKRIVAGQDEIKEEDWVWNDER